jgi:hypothetical protein
MCGSLVQEQVDGLVRAVAVAAIVPAVALVVDAELVEGVPDISDHRSVFDLLVIARTLILQVGVVMTVGLIVVSALSKGDEKAEKSEEEKNRRAHGSLHDAAPSGNRVKH